MTRDLQCGEQSFNSYFRAPVNNYQHILSLTYALKEIKENSKILANVSLGLRIYDSYFKARMTYHNTLSLFPRWKNIVPNYSCDLQKRLIGIIGGLDYKTSLQVNTLSSIYKIPQVYIGNFPYAVLRLDQNTMSLFSTPCSPVVHD